MKVQIKEIRKRAEAFLIKKGLKKTDARIVADEYILGEMHGKKSHGLNALLSWKDRTFDGKAKIKILKKTHAAIYIDGNGMIGNLVAHQAADMVMKMASKQGVGMAFIRNMISWLRPGTIAQYIVKKGYIVIVTNTASVPMVAPPGGYDPIIGTNPYGIGIPVGDDPLVADMATSMRAWGEVRNAQEFGHPLPKDAFWDTKGKVATDPNKVLSAIPFGGYKGFAFALLSEIMGGALVDMPQGVKRKGDYRTLTRGANIIVIDPRFTTSLSKFKKENKKLITKIKRSRKQKGVKEIIIPGERANKKEKDALKTGYIDLDKKLWKQLDELL